ncbi:MAG: hypothetical protein ABEH86_03465 [Haloarcula sp.]
MDIRDAVEDDAERLAALANGPPDVMRNLVHDRTVRVAEEDDDTVGFVSFDAERGTVHVTQLAGTSEACEKLLTDPIEFARREHMSVELLIPEDEAQVRSAVEAVGFSSAGSGPRFDGQPTTRYRLEPERAEH